MRSLVVLAIVGFLSMPCSHPFFDVSANDGIALVVGQEECSAQQLPPETSSKSVQNALDVYSILIECPELADREYDIDQEKVNLFVSSLGSALRYDSYTILAGCLMFLNEDKMGSFYNSKRVTTVWFLLGLAFVEPESTSRMFVEIERVFGLWPVKHDGKKYELIPYPLSGRTQFELINAFRALNNWVDRRRSLDNW